VPRGHSREITFQQDLTDKGEISAHVAQLAAQVAEDAVAAGRTVVRVSVKVRFTPFLTRTRQSKLPAPTTDAAELSRAALAVLDRFELTRPIRLLGVAVDYAMSDQPRSRR
jgi:DNA polymerase-4